MTPFFMLLKKLNLFRVSPEVEAQGLDVSHHGGSAYPHEAAGKGANGGGSGGGSTAAEVAAVRRQWRCGDGVPFVREN